MWSMFKIVQKLAPAPPTDLYSPVAPLSETQNDDLFIYTIPFYNDIYGLCILVPWK